MSIEFTRHDADTIMQGRVVRYTHDHGEYWSTITASLVGGVEISGDYMLRTEEDLKQFCAGLLKQWCQYEHFRETQDGRVPPLGETELEESVKAAGLSLGEGEETL